VSLRRVRLTRERRVEAERIAADAVQQIRALDAGRDDGEADPVTLGLFLFRTPEMTPSDPALPR